MTARLRASTTPKGQRALKVPGTEGVERDEASPRFRIKNSAPNASCHGQMTKARVLSLATPFPALSPFSAKLEYRLF